MRTFYFTGLILSALAGANPVDDGWNAYSVTQYPSGGQSCDRVAEALGQRFTVATGVPVFRASCEKQTLAGYDIALSYAGASVAQISTTKEAGGLGGLGIYRTIAECQTGLAEETRFFQQETGLKPFIAYCYKESSLNGTPFVARIDAFGTAARTPQRFEKLVFSTTVPDAASTLKRVLEVAKAGGIRVHQAAFAHDGSTKLVIRYYASAQEIPFSSRYFRAHEVAKYSALGTRTPYEACLAQLAEADRAYSANYKNPGIWFCGWDNLLFKASLYLLRVQPQEGIRTDTAPDRFATFAECDAQRTALKQWYQQKLGLDPVAVLCSWKSGLGTGKADAFVLKVIVKLPELEPPGLTDPDIGLTAHTEKRSP